MRPSTILFVILTFESTWCFRAGLNAFGLTVSSGIDRIEIPSDNPVNLDDWLATELHKRSNGVDEIPWEVCGYPNPRDGFGDEELPTLAEKYRDFVARSGKLHDKEGSLHGFALDYGEYLKHSNECLEIIADSYAYEIRNGPDVVDPIVRLAIEDLLRVSERLGSKCSKLTLALRDIPNEVGLVTLRSRVRTRAVKECGTENLHSLPHMKPPEARLLEALNDFKAELDIALLLRPGQRPVRRPVTPQDRIQTILRDFSERVADADLISIVDLLGHPAASGAYSWGANKVVAALKSFFKLRFIEGKALRPSIGLKGSVLNLLSESSENRFNMLGRVAICGELSKTVDGNLFVEYLRLDYVLSLLESPVRPKLVKQFRETIAERLLLSFNRALETDSLHSSYWIVDAIRSLAFRYMYVDGMQSEAGSPGSTMHLMGTQIRARLPVDPRSRPWNPDSFLRSFRKIFDE